MVETCKDCGAKFDETLKYWSDGFLKYGFYLHPGLTPEENAAEWAKRFDNASQLLSQVKALYAWAEGHWDYDAPLLERLRNILNTK